MPVDELQDITVEGLGLLPVDRVGGLGQHDEVGAGDMGVQIYWVGLSPDLSVPTHRWSPTPVSI
jgi:hypothetical protein